MGAATAAALVTPGCSRGRSDEPAPAEPARFATGNKGGVYDQYGTGLAKLVSEVTGVSMTTVQTAGSVANLRMLAKGTADIAFSLSDSALDAWEGQETFKTGALRFSALARTYDNYVHVVVPTASNIFKIGDLRDKDVGIGPANSGTNVIARRILSTAEVRVRPWAYDLETAVARLTLRAKSPEKPGGIDALIWSGGLPTEPIAKLQTTIGFRLVDIGAELFAMSVSCARAQALRAGPDRAEAAGALHDQLSRQQDPPHVPLGRGPGVHPAVGLPALQLGPDPGSAQLPAGQTRPVRLLGLVDPEHDVPPPDRPDGLPPRSRLPGRPLRDRHHADPPPPRSRTLVPQQPHLSRTTGTCLHRPAGRVSRQ